eukprot:7749762-Ditylum_brightwellii.AAC.1
MKKYKNEEIYYVNNLKEGRGGWVVNNRPCDVLWETTDIGSMKCVGKKAKDVFETQCKVKTIDEYNRWF